MLVMHPHPSLFQALMAELDRERTRVVRRPSPRRGISHLRVARSRRAARAAAAGC
jgi:hypothetical protein